MTPPTPTARFLQAAVRFRLPDSWILDYSAVVIQSYSEPPVCDPENLDSILEWLCAHNYTRWVPPNPAARARGFILRPGNPKPPDWLIEAASRLNEEAGGFYTWTDEGWRNAVEMVNKSRQPSLRYRHLYNTLAHWAYENSPPGLPAELPDFFETDGWWFLGAPMTWAEIFEAVLFLEREGFLRAVGVLSSRGRLWLTDLGIIFVQSEKDLRTFMADRTPQGNSFNTTHNTVNIHGNTNNSNIASGSHNSQAITHGVDAHSLAQLVSQLRQIAPSLDLPVDDAQDLAQEINALEREGVEPGRGRRIWRRIARIVTPALTSAVAAGSEQAVQTAITAGSQMFG
ncbi:hypothetical protein ACFWC5_20735 [Streptomyces sp. NPDC060085]|uniref:hypothetical protein n=1 Tax=Streptomyces sp. NPDC060085 TaxID=3347054 RepID=UPI00365B9684